jgi:GNAT superfamily N-acetyltransferase
MGHDGRDGREQRDGLERLQALARAVEASWCAEWASLGDVPATALGQPHTIVEDTPTFLRVYTPGIPETLLNLVMRYAADPSSGPVTTADVERTLAPYREHGLPTQWWVLLGTEPPGLREALRALGMQTWGGATAMTLPLAEVGEAERGYPQPPRGVELGRVTAADDGLAALRVIADVFYIPAAPMRRWTIDNPAVQVYAARWEGRVVAALAAMTKDGVAGFFNVATRPGARRRGIAGNLMRYALREARLAGSTLATLTATVEARHLYGQLGFRACGVIEQWMPGPRLMRTLTRTGAGAYDLDDLYDEWV